jgi:predicted ATP-binding protein involved in virulence
MELVYLWVEDYKNIDHQGFNFSPRFRCEYDEKKNELTINENKDYVSIFPDNINITAIVGENGSGKTTILDVLTNMHQDLNKLIVYFDRKKLIVKSTLLESVTMSCVNKGVTKLEELKHNTETYESFYNIYQKNFLVNKERKYDSYWGDVISVNYLEPNKNIQLMINLLKNEKIKLPFQAPKYFTISLRDTINFDKIIESKIKRDESFQINFIENNFFNLDYDKKENSLKLIKFYLIIANIFTCNVDLNSAFANIFSHNQNPQSIDDIITMFLSSLSTEKQQNINYIIQNLDNSFAANQYNTEFTIEVDKLDINFINKYRSLIFLENSHNSQENNIFDFSFDIDLSDGEYEFLLIFSRFYEKIRNKATTILVDEGESSLHPNWQKRYIDFLIQFLEKNYQNQIQLILTTHSPFILSDLPKENVIFLEKGKQVDPNIETFGANIHTLLSHGFFMENGLMGEYAENKIQDVINFLNNEKSKIQTKEDALKIIQIIGEPFLQYKLEEKFHERFSTDTIKNEAKIKRLEQEIERLKNVKPKD